MLCANTATLQIQANNNAGRFANDLLKKVAKTKAQ